MIRFLKGLLVLHVSSSLWYGCIFAIFSDKGSMLEGFFKGALIMPLFFGNFIYLGCLAFSTVGAYFFLGERK